MQTANVIDYRITPSFKREIIKIVDNRINEVHAKNPKDIVTQTNHNIFGE